MTYFELIQNISRRNEMKRNRALLDDFYAEVKRAVWEHGRLVIPGFVIFEVRTTKARTVRNPVTSELMKLSAAKTVKVRASKDWRRR